MASSKVVRFCGGVMKRVGDSGLSNPLVAAVVPLVAQLFVSLIQKAKCLQPAPNDPPAPLQSRALSRYNVDVDGTVVAGVKEMKRAAIEAGRRTCRSEKRPFRRADWVISDADAKHLVLAHVNEAISTSPQAANEIVSAIVTDLGTEPVIGS